MCSRFQAHLCPTSLLLCLLAVGVVLEHDFVARHPLQLLFALGRLHTYFPELAVLPDSVRALLRLKIFQVALRGGLLVDGAELIFVLVIRVAPRLALLNVDGLRVGMLHVLLAHH